MLLSVVILICLASVATGQEKRILLEDNYYTLVARLDALEKQVSRLDGLEQHVNAVEAELASLKQNGQDERILIDDNYYTIVSRLDALEKQVDRLNVVEAELASLKQNVKNNPKVVFMAELTQTVTGTNHHIYFDKVTLNEGNAYNPHHGTFVAPVNGTYQFTITTCSTGGHYNILDLVANTEVVGRVTCGDTTYVECTSNTFYVILNSCDDVYVRHQADGDFIYASGRLGLPVFGGVLLHTN
ncbi:heavy metal-binding protein HIP-like isoform X2 [Mya arenaria]|uniref:heavy metal-binding protein HIP-like isoform X2 n=1 Tax=Mya arenaria TaxID=6604 RepID=UPI0022E17281|nr:heavy metal-binding protein HIP-like isoform X2 [Mya arenaria]